MFGSEVERLFGARRYLIYYLLCVVGAALMHLIVVYVAPDLPLAPTVGASGGVFGLLLAFGMAFPRRELIIFPIPVPIQAWLAVTLYGAMELLSWRHAHGLGRRALRASRRHGHRLRADPLLAGAAAQAAAVAQRFGAAQLDDRFTQRLQVRVLGRNRRADDAGRSSARSAAASASTPVCTCARTSSPTGPSAPSARPAPAFP